MKDNKKLNIARTYLKRKKGETIQLDVYLTKVSQLTIEKYEGKSKMTSFNENKIIVLLPCDIRKKRKDIYKNLNIEPNQIKFTISNAPLKGNEKVNEATQTNNLLDSTNENLDFKKNYKNSNNNSNVFISKELNILKNTINNNQFENIDINANFINIVKTLNPINKNDIKIVKIFGDGNCLYRCLSYFLLGNDQFYVEIKNEIIKWIENNREEFDEFFGDDDANNKSKEELAEEEYNYIKSKDSWGGFIPLKSLVYCLVCR